MRKETQTSVENLLEALEKNREGVNDAFEQLRNDIGSKAHDLHKANQDDKANGIKMPIGLISIMRLLMSKQPFLGQRNQQKMSIMQLEDCVRR